MTQDEFETVYETLANGIDAVGPDRSEIYLAKIALALAEQLGNPVDCLSTIEECRTGLVDARQPRGT